MKLLAGLLMVVALFSGSAALFFVGAVALVIAASSGLWMGRVAGSLLVRRTVADTRLFFGETTTVTLAVQNLSGLPIPWLQVRDEVPPSLTARGRNTQVITLGPRAQRRISYTLTGLRRGYHALGPLCLSSGDVFGLSEQELQAQSSLQVLVYPRLLPGEGLDLPSRAPFGMLRSRRLLQGDPARVVGVRDYLPGDAFHDIHWRATAAAGVLQVKQYQPTTTIQAMIFLDLQVGSYSTAYSVALPELAISVAATLATRLTRERQEVGLVINGRLYLPPESEAGPMGPPLYETAPSAVSPARGQTHLLRLLEILARAETQRQAMPLTELLTRHSLGLPWGSTIAVITGQVDDTLFLTMHQLREAGLLVMLYAIGHQPDQERLQARARSLGVCLRLVHYS